MAEDTRLFYSPLTNTSKVVIFKSDLDLGAFVRKTFGLLMACAVLAACKSPTATTVVKTVIQVDTVFNTDTIIHADTIIRVDTLKPKPDTIIRLDTLIKRDTVFQPVLNGSWSGVSGDGSTITLAVANGVGSGTITRSSGKNDAGYIYSMTVYGDTLTIVLHNNSSFPPSNVILWKFVASISLFSPLNSFTGMMISYTSVWLPPGYSFTLTRQP